MPSRPTIALAFAAGILALALAGCGSQPAPVPAVSPPATPSTQVTADAQPTPTQTVAPDDVTCESIVTDDLRAQLTAQGWTARDEPFEVGGVSIPEGIVCMWADFDVPSGNFMLFGWAPITADQAKKARANLVSSGWTEEESPDGVYVTEDPNRAPTVDENGYGTTYQFGDGWVTIADVKQTLPLIKRPGS